MTTTVGPGQHQRESRALVTTPPRRPATLEPAATATLLRDGPTGLEVLLMRRTATLAFGGNWVFPGGRVEPSDAEGLDADDQLGAARRAAVRETMEETAVVLDPDALVWFSHWTPPPTTARRFATHFFAASAPHHDVEITVDGSEADDWTWIAPAEALVERDRGTLDLRPPTWITLDQLRRFETVEAALAVLGDAPVEHFETRLSTIGPHRIALYHGDAGYDSADATVAGPRHRLVMSTDRWHYERDDPPRP